jgi:hypothetical protein
MARTGKRIMSLIGEGLTCDAWPSETHSADLWRRRLHDEKQDIHFVHFSLDRRGPQMHNGASAKMAGQSTEQHSSTPKSTAHK